MTTINGSLQVTLNNSFPDLTTTGYHLDETITAQVAEEARPAGVNTTSVDYYIQVDYDINQHITHNNSSTVPGEDDAWSLSSIIINSWENPGNLNISKNLPVVNNYDVNAGFIYTVAGAEGINFEGALFYSVILQLSLDNQGNLTADVNIQGSSNSSSTTASISEKSNYAQVVKFDLSGATATIGNISPDSLSDTIDTLQIQNTYQSNLDSIKNEFHNKNIINDFTITVSEIPLATDNPLSRIANSKSKTDQNVFDQEELVLLASPFDYTFTVKSYSMGDVTVVSNSVYAVIRNMSSN